MTVEGLTYDHDHSNCARLMCPRCNWDPVTQRIEPDQRTIFEEFYSCSICETCWMDYQADMLPEERDEWLIEEEPDLWV